jgi:hypothetical protein
MGKNSLSHLLSTQQPRRKYIFFYMCHMIKLIRNTLGDKGYLYDGNNNKISWNCIRKLQELQNEEGLTAATKLTKRHIHFEENRMKVKFAVQTLSESVCNGLKFAKGLNLEGFEGCEATSEFCLNFNNAFDISNCKNKFSRDRFRVPLNEVNYRKIHTEVKRLITYIENLKDNTRTPILQSKRKTGFLGVILFFKKMFSLYHALVDGNELN